MIAPIRIEQLTLNKFFPNLSKPKNNSPITKKKEVYSHSSREGYKSRMKGDGTVYIKETHFLNCGSRLVKNGSIPGMQF